MESTGNFYQEEIRCGYTVTSKSKRIWAVQLSLLDEVHRICVKYGIPYFADSGTLIGAIRHKGYIPWDDDIDLVMLRPDYERFIALAPNELTSPVVLQTPFTEENYLRAHAQLRNSHTTGCNKEDIRAGYNCGIFIDIFPLDSMPARPIEQKLWAALVKYCWMLLYTWYRFGYYENITLAGKFLHFIGCRLHIPMKKAFSFYDKLCRLYEHKNTAYICNTVFIRSLKKNTWKRSWFRKARLVPFENRKIPVPAGYDARLKTEYGDYMKPMKAPTLHGDLVLDPDTGYKEYLARNAPQSFL